jgi:hypothetical protein
MAAASGASPSLIETFACKVLGVDASAAMRGLALDYVSSISFSVTSRPMLEVMIKGGLRANGAFAVRVLQHAFQPEQDARFIRRSLLRRAVRRGQHQRPRRAGPRETLGE